MNYSELLSYARCERPNGTFYGTGGTCRKGTPVGAREEHRPLREAVVQGRFNLSHKGHADFIKKVLEKSDKVTVVVSTKEGDRPGGRDGKKGNLDWNFRVLMLRNALKAEGVDTRNRVKFVKGESPDATIKDMLKRNGKKEVGVFLGKDAINGEFARRLASKYGIVGDLVPSPEGANLSSTRIRKAVDSGDWGDLNDILDGNPFMTRLAVLGRSLELS